MITHAWLGAPVEKFNDDIDTWTIESLKSAGATVRVLDEDETLLAYVIEDAHVVFALLEFVSCPIVDGKNGESRFGMTFNGSGFSGSLREMRHIWWGENGGYTYMLSMRAVSLAFVALAEWFDGYYVPCRSCKRALTVKSVACEKCGEGTPAVDVIDYKEAY